MEELPFEDIINDSIRIRTFQSSVDADELKWHYDNEDRKIEVLKSEGWMLQMDDELPKPLIEGEFYYIPKGVYHRAIKGSGDLIVKIQFT